MEINDVVVVLARSYSGDLAVGTITDETVHGTYRIHWGNVYDYLERKDLRLATDSEAKLAKPPVHPSRRLGFP